MPASLYIPVASPLQDYVTQIWEVQGSGHLQETILPKGVVEIIFNFSESIEGSLSLSRTTRRISAAYLNPSPA